ncbi:ABC transporter transmembrane domain-containing protein [Motilimonas sp. E26]|uniref:ABC transporter ATP-binding protein n=1 Tax=Motilimonas sp. E26 TaxID=2865674 RepID=UPI001E51B205|nr:ABC transporter transmembrane domain-containing protein [Motilimonas sp. E26]MCE0555351.1 ATP-binding cassette domain-containing protein [Motilimonas sp. E26]
MEFINQIGWFIRLHKWRYLLIFMAIVAASVCSLIPPLLIASLVDQLAKAQSFDLLNLWPTVLQLVALAISTYLLRFFWRYYLFGSALELERNLMVQLYSHCCRMPGPFFQRHSSAKLLNHLNSDVNAVSQGVGNGVIFFVDAFVMSSLVLVVLATQISWLLTLVVLLPLPILALSIKRYGQQMQSRIQQSQHQLSLFYQQVQQTVNGISVIKGHACQGVSQQQFDHQLAQLTQANIEQARVEAKYEPTTAMVAAGSFFLTLSVGSLLVAQQQITLGELLAFNLYLGYLIWPMNAFGFLFSTLTMASVSMKRIEQVLNDDQLGYAHQAPTVPTKQTTLIKLDVDYFSHHNHQVANEDSFDEPDQAALLFKDVHFSAQRGQIQAIVGPVACGKSSLLRLLLGSSTIESVQRSLHPDTNIAYVPQDCALFTGTIRENIALGDPDASLKRIKFAANLACLSKDIDTFPLGYDTQVGENGSQLSGGQKQRLAIARALLTQADILLLDDSLSALDNATCSQLLFNLKCWMAGTKTVILASSRFDLLSQADRVLLLRPEHQPLYLPHSELLTRDSWYQQQYQHGRSTEGSH